MINSRKLSDLRTDVRANCELWLAACKKAGLDVLVTQTLRDNEYQATLYAQGRTKPGNIVTNSKTVSFHGCGLAFDFCRNVKGHEYDSLTFFRKAAEIAKGFGFSWGGDWASFPDRPHLQWDDHGKYTNAMVRAKKYPPAMAVVEEDMDISKLTDKECYELLQRAQRYAETLPVSDWAKDEVSAAVDMGITDGAAPKRLATREEVAAMVARG